MHKITPLLCLLILMMAAGKSPGQTPKYENHEDTSSVIYVKANQLSPANIDSIPLKKHLHGFHNYMPRQHYGTFFQKQSNPGHALKHLQLSPQMLINQYHGGYHFYHAFEPYLRTKNNIRYFSSKKPFTQLFYVMGSHNEQHLTVLHAQPLTANVFFSVEHKILHAPGIYQRSFSKHQSPVLNLRYRSNNNKYNALATYFHNSIKVEEHGGIQANTYFTDSATFNERQLIPVNLSEAQQVIRGGGFHFRQSYAPWADSAMHPDSARMTIYHDVFYQKDTYTYSDEGDTSGFYPQRPIDTIPVFDSVAVNRFTQTAGIHFLINNTKIDAGLTHEYAQLWQNGGEKHFNRLEPKVMARYRGEEYGFSFLGSMDFFRETNQYTTRASLFRYLPQGTMALHGGYHLARPAYMYQKFSSSYYNWDNTFQRSSIYFSGLSVHNQYGSLSATYFGLNNHIYLDTDGLPRQHGETVHLVQLKAHPRVSWQFIHLNSKLVWQYQADGDDLLRLPQLMAKADLYASFNLIRDVLNTHAGVQVLWHSAFQGSRYVPALRQFAHQNQQTLGNYPYMNVFANFIIDRARFFVRYEHLNALLGNRSYFLMPQYPMRDNAFQFGVSWTFYD